MADMLDMIRNELDCKLGSTFSVYSISRPRAGPLCNFLSEQAGHGCARDVVTNPPPRVVSVVLKMSAMIAARFTAPRKNW